MMRVSLVTGTLSDSLRVCVCVSYERVLEMGGGGGGGGGVSTSKYAS